MRRNTHTSPGLTVTQRETPKKARQRTQRKAPKSQTQPPPKTASSEVPVDDSTQKAEEWPDNQPGIDFDTALISAALGVSRPSVPVREAATLACSLVTKPRAWVGPVAKLVGQLGQIAVGKLDQEPAVGDRRYADPAWKHPLFRAFAQTHRAVGATVEEIIDRALEDPGDLYRMHLATSNITAALSPANNALTNPAALKMTFETRGQNLTLGSKRFIVDMLDPPRIPARSEPGRFTLGVDVAATPGAVVLRTPTFELLQYSPTTKQVLDEPLLMIPSLVNKYYLTDLAPNRSMVEFAVNSGLQVFHVSWVNPGPDHRTLDLDEYVAAIVKAIDSVKAITGRDRLHVFGTCAGGQLTTIALAHLAHLGRHEEIASYTLPVCIMDHGSDASLSGMLNQRAATKALDRMTRIGYIDGRVLGGTLQFMRPIDGIWSAFVQRYLLAENVPRVDLFHWSEDTTNLPAALARDLMELTLENRLMRPGAQRVLGTPVDLKKLTAPAYLVAGTRDHMTEWRSCFSTTRMTNSPTRFILVNAGHLQAILQMPNGRPIGFRTAPVRTEEPDVWLETAGHQDGSWWDDWRAWLESNSTGTRQAPSGLGSAALPPIGAAPGRYVRRRLDTTP